MDKVDNNNKYNYNKKINVDESLQYANNIQESNTFNFNHNNQEIINYQNNRDKLEKEIKLTFDYFDEDNSGGISKEEMLKVMKSLGINPTNIELQEIFEELDKEKQGFINYESFKKLLTKSVNEEYIISSTIEAFTLFDKNTNKTKKNISFNSSKNNSRKTTSNNKLDANEDEGFIEKKELYNILQTTCSMNKADIDLLIQDLDWDENGKINYKNLVTETFKVLNIS